MKTAALAAFSSGLVARQALAGESLLSTIHINKLGLGGKMKMTFFPYELKLRHVFTVATYSRITTPDVQVEIEYEGVTGYGEASMPPYLGETVESVMNFLGKVNLEQFSDPFQLDDILSYVDSLSPKDTAAKAAVDIALHDLVGKLLGAPWYKIWGTVMITVCVLNAGIYFLLFFKSKSRHSKWTFYGLIGGAVIKSILHIVQIQWTFRYEYWDASVSTYLPVVWTMIIAIIGVLLLKNAEKSEMEEEMQEK